MIKRFHEKILNTIRTDCDYTLKILKWLILYKNCNAYRDPYPPCDSIAEDMIESCQKILDKFDLNERTLSNSKYLDLIYGDIMKEMSKRIKTNTASDYDILLYVYIILTEPHPILNDEKVLNGNILNTIIWEIFRDPVELVPDNIVEYERSANNEINPKYAKKIQDIAGDMYKKLTQNITADSNIEDFEESRITKEIKYIVNNKWQELIQTLKDGSYERYASQFASDIYTELDKRFPYDKYEESVNKIADSISKKIIAEIFNDKSGELTENTVDDKYREFAENIVNDKYVQLAKSLEDSSIPNYYSHEELLQKFVDDICKKFNIRFLCSKYVESIKNIADDICKKILGSVSTDRKFIAQDRQSIYTQIVKDTIRDKYDNLFQAYVDDRREKFFLMFINAIYKEFHYININAKNECNVEVEEYIIYALYLRLADAGILAEYNSKIKTVSENEKTVFNPSIHGNPSDYDDAVELLNKCKGSPSQYNYYYYKTAKKKSNTLKNLEDHFSGILSGMKKSAFTFFPSFITLIINQLEPKKHNKPYDYKICDFPYDKYMPSLEYITNDTKTLDIRSISIFLKLIVSFENFSYGTNKQHDVETWFEQQRNEMEKYEYDTNSEKYIKTLPPQDQRLFRGLWATYDKKPNFYLSYFDIFLHVYKMREDTILKKHSEYSMDLALSLFHLNIFTRWYDALLLIEGMPFKFLKYNSLYLKLLTIPFINGFEDKIFLDMVENLIKITNIDLKQALINKDPNIEWEDISLLFYRKSKEKLHDDALADILNRNKNSIKRKCIKDINPIYKLIYLLDNPDKNYDNLHQLLHTNYNDYIHKLCSINRVISNTEYEDGYSLI